MPETRMLEDEVIEHLKLHLSGAGWQIQACALGRAHGYDIHAIRSSRELVVEAKGARGNPKLPGVVRSQFDSGQVKDHLGKAIVKVLEQKQAAPSRLFCIAQPASPTIVKISKPIAMELSQLGIYFAFIHADGRVSWHGDIVPE